MQPGGGPNADVAQWGGLDPFSLIEGNFAARSKIQLQGAGRGGAALLFPKEAAVPPTPSPAPRRHRIQRMDKSRCSGPLRPIESRPTLADVFPQRRGEAHKSPLWQRRGSRGESGSTIPLEGKGGKRGDPIRHPASHGSQRDASEKPTKAAARPLAFRDRLLRHTQALLQHRHISCQRSALKTGYSRWPFQGWGEKWVGVSPPSPLPFLSPFSKAEGGGAQTEKLAPPANLLPRLGHPPQLQPCVRFPGSQLHLSSIGLTSEETCTDLLSVLWVGQPWQDQST